jgi:hypothetical protein
MKHWMITSAEGDVETPDFVFAGTALPGHVISIGSATTPIITARQILYIRRGNRLFEIEGKPLSWHTRYTVSLTPGSQALMDSLREYFSDREDVEGIYLNDERGRSVVTVVTNHQQYNREAMYELLEREYNLRQQHRGVEIEINYLPRLDRDPADIIPDSAFVLYLR